ncbi:MAG: insulinase family protein [Candidatus Electrothrix sp. AR4]|nr:insulinase family protein [Candidatus Electrothrix sp. AR4]
MKRYRTLFLSLFIALHLLALLGTASSPAKGTPSPPETCISKGWPHEQSDLKPDPSLIFGTLKNGIRYMIMPNHEPKNRVAMYLNVQAGSIHETEEQNGLAHYLEHMLFNGTTHYPPGTLVEYFQSIGMGFGGDTNAHTYYNETVCKLVLPRGDPKTLNNGMQVLADYAGGALLLEKEVDRERGIIQAEKRARNSASKRLFQKKMKSSFAGTLIARHDIIGTDEVLRNADAALLRQYYERWYRPDNMIVVVVGDAETKLIEEVINKNFSELRSKSDTPDCPDIGQVAEIGTEPVYLFEKDLGYTDISIESVWNVEPPRPTKAAALLDLKKYTASVMMDNRLQQLLNREDSPMTWANVYHGRIIRRFGYSTMTARTSADRWRQTLELLNTSLRQAIQFGFSMPELARAKSEILTQLKKEVQVADSRKSSGLAHNIIRDLNDGEITLSPTQKLALFGPALKKLTLTEVNRTFGSLWHKRRLIKVMGTADLKGDKSGITPKSIILKALHAAETAEITPWVQEKEADFPYLPPPENKAEIAQHIPYSKIKADRYVFKNGLILNLKTTDFEPNELRVTVALGNGILSEPKPGLALLAEMLLPESGVGGLNKDQLKTALAPYSTTVHFRAEEESFRFTGKGLNSESELLFQLLYTHIHDPAFRADAFKRGMQRIGQAYAQMQSSVEGMMELRGERFLAGGNLRYGAVPLEMLNTVRLTDLKQWLEPILKNEGLEISVVGDFDRNTILQLAGRYFGGKSRKDIQLAPGKQIPFPSGKALSLPVTTNSEKGLITVAWPTEDLWDISRTRRLSVLAAVFRDRLRKQIREELGATYSPYAYNHSSTVDPGYGVLRSGIVVDPAQAALLTDKLKQVGSQLAANKVTTEELQRTLEPILTSIRDAVRTNRYWLESVLVNSSRYPQRLEWPLNFQQDYASVTPEEVTALAAQYLRVEKAAEVVLLPKKKK